MYLELLFVLCAIVPYAEPHLAGIAGRAPSSFLMALSAIGIVAILAVFVAEAM